MILNINGRDIGPGHPCFVIAEAGVNHNGDVELAMQLIRAAANAGVDAVKFQTFIPEKLVAAEAPRAEYQRAATGKAGSQLDLLLPLVLPRNAYKGLIAEAQKHNLLLFSTPFDSDSAEFLDQLGMPAFKVSSGDLTDHPFLAKLARKGRPLLISSGMASMPEVRAALAIVATHGNPPVGLFHCVSNYPTSPSDCNILAMNSLRREFSVPVGWSDHTEGTDITLAAVALGADLIEKHFTLDRNLPGPDHKASLEPGELKMMMRDIRRIELARGNGIKQPAASEIPIAKLARKSLFWAVSLKSGAVICDEHLNALRPGTGLSPIQQAGLIGRKISRPVLAGQMVLESDF